MEKVKDLASWGFIEDVLDGWWSVGEVGNLKNFFEVGVFEIGFCGFLVSFSRYWLATTDFWSEIKTSFLLLR